MTLKIDPEFQALIPPLAPEELAQLEAALKAEGCRDALIVWEEEGLLLDGHNRYAICDRLKIPYKTKGLSFDDQDAAKLWMINNQTGRRNLSDDQRAILACRRQEIMSAIAKRERAKKAGETGGRNHPKLSLEADATPKLTEPRERTRKQAATEFKVSERKVRQAGAIMKAAPELAKRVLDGEIPLAAATREIKRAELKEQLETVAAREIEAPSGEYDVIVIDPPWPMAKIDRDERPNQVAFDYPTMSEKELEALEVPCADDCHVWLWTTHRFLPMALRLLDSWGLEYCCAFVWAKAGGFQPVGLPQFNCEFALYARRGSPRFIDTKAFSVCFEGRRGKHSEKPEEFYAVLRRVTGGRRLDMFNRRKIEGFTGWGKES